MGIPGALLCALRSSALPLLLAHLLCNGLYILTLFCGWKCFAKCFEEEKRFLLFQQKKKEKGNCILEHSLNYLHEKL